MQLKPEALNALKLPVKVKAGFLGSVKIKVCEISTRTVYDHVSHWDFHTKLNSFKYVYNYFDSQFGKVMYQNLLIRNEGNSKLKSELKNFVLQLHGH